MITFSNTSPDIPYLQVHLSVLKGNTNNWQVEEEVNGEFKRIMTAPQDNNINDHYPHPNLLMRNKEFHSRRHR